MIKHITTLRVNKHMAPAGIDIAVEELDDGEKAITVNGSRTDMMMSAQEAMDMRDGLTEAISFLVTPKA